MVTLHDVARDGKVIRCTVVTSENSIKEHRAVDRIIIIIITTTVKLETFFFFSSS